MWSGFKGRVSLLEPDVRRMNCSIIVSDLTESDSGSYQLRVDGVWYGKPDGFTFSPRATVSVSDLIQKPTVMIPSLTGGQQTTLTCTAPGLCSGSGPEITWTWRGAGESPVQHCGPYSAVLPWAVAGVCLSVNVFCTIYVIFLWKARKKVKPNQEDRTYMSLQKTDESPEYSVIGQPLN
ncbi:sialic acid-binding Ig-like lectin 14 [Enoplosus armatus]|uniref:sialic acid-binding Ig-like lectin 14 n=1 Tax=Enoplosus armatus TaxID=215367 RepID=UPI003992B1B8